MPILALTPAERQKIVNNTLGTLRVENLSPSESLKTGLEAYVNGQKTTADLLNDIQSKYVTLRRG
ncbi:MAG: antitoxin VbhA family protein [Alcaligenaceae bacterium]|nr:antitoxin VbhA family protein [Alcaligenaceae bacterium]